MRVHGYFWPTQNASKRLAEIGVELGGIAQCGHRDLGYDSISIPDEYAKEFRHKRGDASTPGELYLAADRGE